MSFLKYKIQNIKARSLCGTAWGPPRVKVRGGGKGSWTESQIGMLPVVTLLCINKVKCH